MSDLTPRQTRFVEEYLKDLNASASYQRAGYRARGNSAEASASALLRTPKIAMAVQAQMQARSQRTQITADRTLQEIARLAFVDVRKLYDDDGRLRPVQSLDTDTAAAVAGLEVIELFSGAGDERVSLGETKKVKFWDKTANLTLLARHLGLLLDRQELTGATGGPLQVTQTLNEAITRAYRK